jgi:preprotein translocase subunit YajC
MSFEPLLTLAQGASSGAAQQSPSSGLSMMIPMICIFVIFYFLIIRPQGQKQKEQQALVSSLKTGDKVVTSGGIHGLISNVKETTVIVKVADNVKIEVDKTCVTGVIKRTDDEAATAS